MTFDKFVGEVQHRAQLRSLGEAVRAIRCTLSVLSQRLAEGEAKDLASQLPEEIGIYLIHGQAGAGMDFAADEFLARVSACEGAATPESKCHVMVVLQVVREAISEGQFEHLMGQLPADFKPLFQAGSEGRMRVTGTRRGARRSAGRRGKNVRGSREIVSPLEEVRPRSARITRRAVGPWHLGR